jgi:glycine dehydrogenase subunit 1
MPFFSNTSEDQREMLRVLGAERLEDLFAGIPQELRLSRPLAIPAALTELELHQHLTALSQQNLHADSALCFLGGGSYDHFIPAVVDQIASRGEFYTSYTPYQPEVSQGNLQVMFEYQTLMCQLTGMDVSNASLYDGGSAVAEAVLMAMTVTNRTQKVVVCDTCHPEYQQILATYLINLETKIQRVPSNEGAVDLNQLSKAVDSTTACIVVQSPNFFGVIEDIEAVVEIARKHGAKVIVSCDPLSLGLLKRPGDMGADIVVAEGQSLGSPMAYGGPYLGILACRTEFLRRLPGRIAGQTVDRRDRRCFVLTLQTREQHIRREKATSNICTNQGLFALRAAIYLSLLGPQGLKEVSHLCLHKAHYAAEKITQNERFEIAFASPFFKEFVVRDRHGSVAALLSTARQHNILAGIPLGTWYPAMEDCFLVAVTEKRTKGDIDRWANILHSAPTKELAHA